MTPKKPTENAKMQENQRKIEALQAVNDANELGNVTDHEAFEMLERADQISTLKASLVGKVFSVSSQRIHNAVVHQVELNHRTHSS